MHRPDVDITQAIARVWQRHDRQGHRRLPQQSCQELGE